MIIGLRQRSMTETLIVVHCITSEVYMLYSFWGMQVAHAISWRRQYPMRSDVSGGLHHTKEVQNSIGDYHIPPESQLCGRRDLLQALGVGIASLLWPMPAAFAQQSRGQNLKSQFAFKNGLSSTGWIGFDMPENRYIVLTGMLNQERAEFILDSGVGSMVLDLSLAAKLGLQPEHESTAVSITGVASVTAMGGLTVSIGNLVLTTPETMALDLSSFSVATSRPIHAVLGRDIFAPLIVDIDFEARKIAFRNPKMPAAITGARIVPLLPSNFGRKLSISIEGQRPIEALFDLGSDTPLIISPDYVQRQQLFQGKKTSTSLSVGAAGPEENQVAVIKATEIGGIFLHDIPVSVPNQWALDVQAVVGVPILSRFRLMTDFGRDLIWMLANKGAETQAFQKDRLGMAAMPANDCLRVVHVSPGSPAAAAGLKVGDEVVAVNDQIVDTEYLKSRPRQGMKPSGTMLNVRLRSGSNLAIRLADYY